MYITPPRPQPGLLYERDPLTSSGLTWGYFGGRRKLSDGTARLVVGGTLSLTGSATNYVAENDGVLAVTTSPPAGWPGSLAGGARALYALTCDSTSVTGVVAYDLFQIPVEFPWTIRDEPGEWRAAQWTAQITLTDATNIAVDASVSNCFKVTLAGNRTLNDPTNLVAGMKLTIAISQDATGGRTLAFGSLYEFPDGNSAISTEANARSLLVAYYDGTALRCRLSSASSGGSGTPGGSTTQVQFNDAGTFGGDDGLTWDQAANALFIGTTTTAGKASGKDSSATSTVGAAFTAKAGNGFGDGSSGSAGGTLNLRGGDGGTGTSAGAGGAVLLQGGDSGGTGTAAGGAVTIKGGTATAAAVGGVVTIEGGGSVSSGATKAAAVNIRGGAASSSGSSGDVNISTQNGVGTNRVAGDINLTVGTSNNAQPGSSINATAGTGGSTNGAGGVSTWKGGAGQGSGLGGAAVVQGGNGGATNAQGGNALLKGGTGGGTGAKGNVAVDNGGAIATTATGGFFCLPTCAGAPAGVPANVPTGSVAAIYDTTNNRIYVYNGAWRSVTLS